MGIINISVSLNVVFSLTTDDDISQATESTDTAA
jgi:hypothetical protein